MKIENRKTQTPISFTPLIKNKEIIKSLSFLRRNVKGKDYVKRQTILASKGKALSQLGGLIKDPSRRISAVALQILESIHPELVNKPELNEKD